MTNIVVMSDTWTDQLGAIYSGEVDTNAWLYVLDGYELSHHFLESVPMLVSQPIFIVPVPSVDPLTEAVQLLKVKTIQVVKLIII